MAHFPTWNWTQPHRRASQWTGKTRSFFFNPLRCSRLWSQTGKQSMLSTDRCQFTEILVSAFSCLWVFVNKCLCRLYSFLKSAQVMQVLTANIVGVGVGWKTWHKSHIYSLCLPCNLQVKYLIITCQTLAAEISCMCYKVFSTHPSLSLSPFSLSHLSSPLYAHMCLRAQP